MSLLKKIVLSSISVSALALSVATLASAPHHGGAAQVAPFTDNLSIQAKGFPAGGAYLNYEDNNGLHIYGPDAIAAGDSQPMIHIHADVWNSGDPQMAMVFPTTGEKCVFQLHDGAWVAGLDYTQGEPPVCDHLTISSITQTNQYEYTMSVEYN